MVSLVLPVFFDRQYDGPDLDRLSLGHMNSGNPARKRAWKFHDRLFGFQFHHRLIGFDHVAFFHQQFGDFGFFDVFPRVSGSLNSTAISSSVSMCADVQAPGLNRSDWEGTSGNTSRGHCPRPPDGFST